MPRIFQFEADKALEAILYTAVSIPEPSYHSISKILYFADQRHLSEVGRLLFGDSYVAMKHGPVPSGAYDMMKWAKSPDLGGHRGIPERITGALRIANNHHVTPLRKPDLGYLSRTDREALDWSIAKYGEKSFDELTAASHDAAWESAAENEFVELAAIVAMQPNADELAEHLELNEA